MYGVPVVQPAVEQTQLAATEAEKEADELLANIEDDEEKTKKNRKKKHNDADDAFGAIGDAVANEMFGRWFR